MTEERKQQIYEDECGFECPCGVGECPHQMDDGHTCELEEPWLDCDDFIAENEYAIQDAENRIEWEEMKEKGEEE